MASALLEKLRRSREIKVTVGGKNYTARRPTDIEAIELHNSGSSFAAMAQKFVIGWDLLELDIVPGGGPEPAPFDAELWADWVADKPDLWPVLATAILDAFNAHVAKRTSSEKN